MLKDINNAKPVILEAFIHVPNTKDSPTRCRYIHQFKDDKERSLFINDAQNSGEFFAIKLFINKPSKVELDNLQTELKYINVYASHRSSELESELSSLVAIADVIDVTNEVLPYC